MLSKTLNISTSPHIVKGNSTDTIMLNVVLALIPIAIFAVFSFGLSALLLLTTTTGVCVLTEYLFTKNNTGGSTIGDWSAVITGLLLGMTLPPHFPLWMAALGGFISIALGKLIFGGLGYNVFNPALVGRAFLQAAFPVATTTWMAPFAQSRFTEINSSSLAIPFMEPKVDAMTGATPLSAFKFDQITTATQDLALGLISGSAGETCALLIILGGVYLAARKMLNWRIPLAVIATVFIITGMMYLIDSQTYPSPIMMMFSGGLMFGAVYMATDMVASPLTPLGAVLYGVLIGLLTAVIRLWGGLPEGIMYAILLANAVSPHIDRLIRPRVYGTKLNTEKA